MCQFTSSVLKALHSTLSICEIFYWTDSSVDFEKFKVVPSKLNPADLGTKNLSPKELFGNKLWFSGPQFLSLPRSCWPDLHIGENFSNYNIGNSSINLVDDESLILPSSCTQSKCK